MSMESKVLHNRL